MNADEARREIQRRFTPEQIARFESTIKEADRLGYRLIPHPSSNGVVVVNKSTGEFFVAMQEESN